MTNEKSMELAVVESRGGPKTTEGKAIVSRNAIKHGILANVIPTHETAAYLAHVEAVHAHYQPVGYVEEALTERIATALWRLGRVVRFESAVIKDDTERRLNNYHQPQRSILDFEPQPEPVQWPEDIRSERATLEASLTVHRRGPDALKQADQDQLAAWVMGAWSFALENKRNDSQYSKAMKAIDKLHGITAREADWLEQSVEDGTYTLTWTFDMALQAVALLVSTASHEKPSLPEDWREVEDWLQWHVDRLTRKHDEVIAKHRQLEAREGMPEVNMAQKVAKYEAHIERTLYRAMHELEAMQDRRAGKQAPLARLEVHGAE